MWNDIGAHEMDVVDYLLCWVIQAKHVVKLVYFILWAYILNKVWIKNAIQRKLNHYKNAIQRKLNHYKYPIIIAQTSPNIPIIHALRMKNGGPTIYHFLW